MKKYAVIHGHFYQPPRENPWTGRVERQSSAGEDHDWNERVARECYTPNSRARIARKDSELLVNNYARISFNFGPTLLSWYEKAHPEAYARVIQADRDSRLRSGHGNALAQAFVHAILPLASARDQQTLLRWGLADFERRFGRKAEALWLPETGCDRATLRRLIDLGMKFAILAPRQAEKVRAPTGEWLDVSKGGLDTRRAYRWSDERGRGIALFFYNGELSQAVAFGKLMAHADAAAERIDQAFDAGADGQLVSIATDGETYGHHEKFSEMGLAHLAVEELPKRGIELVNYAEYLERHPPEWDAEIKEGPQGVGTAWSCAHGLGRWLDDCGCGTEGGHGRWRWPLREALDWLRDRLAEQFEREVENAWDVRDSYFEGRLKPGAPRMIELLEAQRFSLYMQTSCAWFFADIGGLEAVQNLKYAARAIELAKRPELEDELVRRLARAPSNDAKLEDGAEVWRALVRTAVRTG